MTPQINETVKKMPEALSIYVNQIVYNKKERGERIYTYSLGEAFFDIPSFEISSEELNKGYHYSSSRGLYNLRKIISDLYKNYQVCANPENEILISAGSKVIIYMLLNVILMPKDEVLIPEPAWLSYKEQVKLLNAVNISIPYGKKIEDWEKYISNKTKCIIINNPNNPSGYLYSKEDLVKILAIAKKHNLFILSDEAYSDFLNIKNKFVSLAGLDLKKENVIVVNSLSKNLGMSGWRIGYAIANKNIIKQLLKLNQHIITCAPTLLQEYLCKHFKEILDKTLPQAVATAEKRVVVQHIMDEIGIKYLPGNGTFYFLLDVSSFKGTTEELVYELLLKHNIATVAGIAYGESIENFIRFGIGVENVDDIKESLKTIKGLLDLEYYDNSSLKMLMQKEGIIANV